MLSLEEKICGCLVCGALGDAFGAPLEGMTLDEIYVKYGENGKKDFDIDGETGKWAVTDDTQMTMFTLEGLILSEGMPIDQRVQIMYESYLRWFNTQFGPGAIDGKIARTGELWKIEELYRMRLPGHACLDSLRSGCMGTIERPYNDSMGNGTVMRSAPFGFLVDESPEYVFELSMRCAAITHGNIEAQLSAGLFSLLIYYLMHGESIDRAGILAMRVYQKTGYNMESLSCRMFTSGFDYVYAPMKRKQHEEKWGECWTAPHALGAATGRAFFSIMYKKDLMGLLSVCGNTDGDSDTVASIAGNIYGASRGLPALSQMEYESLQFKDLICKLGSQISSISPK